MAQFCLSMARFDTTSTVQEGVNLCELKIRKNEHESVQSNNNNLKKAT